MKLTDISARTCKICATSPPSYYTLQECEALKPGKELTRETGVRLTQGNWSPITNS